MKNSGFAAGIGIALCALGGIAGPAAQAAPFELIYTGAFDTDEALTPASAASPNFFASPTSFTVRALFDTSSPNLAPAFGGPFNGFRAYAPTSATITIGGASYSIQTALENPQTGVAVAIFDQNSFTPGRYGIGLFVDPVGDGAGFVGDFGGASPPFTVSSLVPTVFEEFFGVGHSPGPCSSGAPPVCPKIVTPWILRDASGTAYDLTFADYFADYLTVTAPGARLGPLNTAQLVAVPEPSSFALVLLALAGLAWARRPALARLKLGPALPAAAPGRIARGGALR